MENIEDFKLKEKQIFEYKKRIAQAETKLKHQKNLYEDVRSERNLFSKNLIEAKEQNAEMKRKVKIVSHMFEQQRDEITAKEVTLDNERQECQRLERERESLKAKLQKMRQQAQETKQQIEKKDTEAHELRKILADTDAERIRQKIELDQVIIERDLLGTQLVKRNDALALLNEKIRIQQSILKRCEIQYNERLEDIRLLKLEIKMQRQKGNLLNKTVRNVKKLRQENCQMQRELQKETTMRCALEDELRNSMNVHRCRKLEVSCPQTFELIQKKEKERLLQEKDELYVELKNTLAREPVPEAEEKLQVFQRALREKTKQLKALMGELYMRESQVENYKLEIEHLAHELQEVKKKYFAQKKYLERREKDCSTSPAGQPVIQPQLSDNPTSTRGDFCLKKHNRTRLPALQQQP